MAVVLIPTVPTPVTWKFEVLPTDINSFLKSLSWYISSSYPNREGSWTLKTKLLFL